ncbi:MAG: PadR family transcriptional regulator [Actinomycetota bacterium]|nr:PadR family transcriptional regulator [Actinomycetota bacterium]
MTSRSTALEMAVLGLLHDAPMHGYELRKQLIGLLGWGRVLSYGTLYPCLKSLVRDGFLDAEGTSGGRNRIEYTLTAAGKERFVALVAETGPTAWDDDNFGIHFAFFARADLPTRVRILEGRRSRLEQRLDHFRASISRSRERRDAYTLELQRHGLESGKREVRWLTELIHAERAGGRPPGGSNPNPPPKETS